jgi:glycosyltransferase involved in cell wall biosynthesis
LGKKRNFLNEKCSGDIIIYMDDDDYYPPERISHAVDMLRQNPKALCAGSSAMYIYFKHINKMYQFGPYGPNHATAATFAFRKELLKQTKFDEESCVAEEKKFLKDYTIPMVQLESKKSILVFSHNHNSFDKKELLKHVPNKNVREVNICPSDIIKESEILHFFMEDIDKLLDTYEAGKPENKPDVVQQLQKIKQLREEKIREYMRKQDEYKNSLKNSQNVLANNTQTSQNIINEQSLIIQQLTIENQELKDKINYLDNKITQLINTMIQDKMTAKISE